MKKIQDNLHYFEISKNNQEKLFDDFYVFDKKHPDLNKYIKNTKEIKDILITIRTLQNKKEKSDVVDKYFLELSKIIGKYSNCSEFACFVNACDNIINKAKNEINLLKKITERYFLPRNSLSAEDCCVFSLQQSLPVRLQGILSRRVWSVITINKSYITGRVLSQAQETLPQQRRG